MQSGEHQCSLPVESNRSARYAARVAQIASCRTFLILELSLALLCCGKGWGAKSPVERPPETIQTREIGGVKLRPAAAQLLADVKRLYGASVSVVPRDDFGLGIEGYSDVSQDGRPVINVAHGVGEYETNVAHELFHLKMWAEGYPLFEYDMPQAERAAHGAFYDQMRTWIYDPLTHSVFYPKMRAMGFDPDANTREMLQYNRTHPLPVGSPPVAPEWRALYLMKVAIETNDEGVQADVEQWYREKGWSWELEHGRTLVRTAKTSDLSSKEIASAFVACANELFAGRVAFTLERIEKRQYGKVQRAFAIIKVEPLGS